jgi:hypothetical protein
MIYVGCVVVWLAGFIGVTFPAKIANQLRIQKYLVKKKTPLIIERYGGGGVKQGNHGYHQT